MGELEGLRVVVTRAAHQLEELAGPLRTLGAEVLALPMIGIVPPLDSEPLRQAALSASSYRWIIFTSANAVTAFVSAFNGSPNSIAARIATVGAATREAAEQAGLHVDLVPANYIAESLAEALAGEDLAGRRILIPSAAVSRDVVPAALRQRGATVDVVEAYRNVTPPEAAALAPRIFRPPYPDWVTFASSSAVDHLVQLIGVEPLSHSKIATIGPATSNTVRKHRLSVDAEARAHDVTGLVEAVTAGR